MIVLPGTYPVKGARHSIRKEEEKRQEENAGPRRPVVTRDFYFDEAMRVTTDYLAILSGVMPSVAKTENGARPESID